MSIIAVVGHGLRAQAPEGKTAVESAKVDAGGPPPDSQAPKPKPARHGLVPALPKASTAAPGKPGPDTPSVGPTKPIVASEATPGRDCARPDVLGTSRTIPFGTKGGPAVGLKTYPQTLQLADKEVVLTFDDGPQPGTTDKVLEALRAECVRATFFLIGKNALAHKSLAVRELAEGHSLGNHSWSHPTVTLRGLPESEAVDEIQHGFSAISEATAGARGGPVAVQFFRFPGFSDSAPLRQYLIDKNVAIFGADLWASDWRTMTPEVELNLLMERLHAERRGIILLHDTRSQTALMLPAFLRRLKDEGYKVVHIEQSASAPPELRPAPAGWSSETESILSRVMPRLTGAKHKPAVEPPLPLEPHAAGNHPKPAESKTHPDVF